MQMPGLLWGSLLCGVLNSSSGRLTAPLAWSYRATNWGTPGARPVALPGHTNHVEPSCVTANEAPPECLFMPRQSSVTCVGVGTTRRSPSRYGLVTHREKRSPRRPSSGSGVGRQKARNGGPSISLCPTQCSTVNSPAGSSKTFHVRQRSRETMRTLRVLPSVSWIVRGL